MYKILQKDFRQLKPPVLAVEYNTNTAYDNFQGSLYIYYELKDRMIYEEFPIQTPELGVGWDACMRELRRIPLGEKMPLSSLETKRDTYYDDLDNEAVYIVYEPEDIKSMICKLQEILNVTN